MILKRVGGDLTKPSLGSRKRQFVRDTIFEAAVDLFAARGFDDTTVEEVAQAAGVSRASFFRYFSSKDDLLAQNVVKYGLALTEAIKTCPPSLAPLDTVRETILSVAKLTVNHPRTRQVIDIAQRSASATQAHMARMIEVEERVAIAFAERFGSPSKDDLEPRMLANLTVLIMNLAIMSWYRGESPELITAAEHVFFRLSQIFRNQTQDSTQAAK